MPNFLKSLALTLLLTAVPSLAFAAPPWILKGRLRQAGTREPLAGLRVCLKERPEACGVSGPGGDFSIEVPEPGAYTAVIPDAEPERFRPAAFRIGPTNPAPRVTLYYDRELIALPTLVVTAPAEAEKVSRRVVTSQELKQVPGGLGDPLKAIQTLPGVAVGNDASSNPAIRGSRPDDNRYYVDDQPVGYLFHMGDLLSVFNAGLVQEFDIRASAFAPEYESVVGGVIDVRLRDPRTDRFGARLNLSAFESDLLVEGPLTPKQSFFLAGRRSYLDLFISSLGGGFGDQIDVIQFPEFYDYQGKYVWRPDERNTFAFETGGAWDKLAIDIKDDSDIAAHDPDLAGRIGQSQDFHSQALLWTSEPAPGLRNRLVVSHLFNEFSLDAENLGFGRGLESHFSIYEAFSFPLSDAHDVTVGGRHTYSDTGLDFDIKVDFPSEFDPDTDFTGAGRKVLDTNVYANASQFFAKDRWRALPRLTILGGARATRNTFVDERHLEPWAGLEYSLTANTLILGAWGLYHQPPQGQEVVEPFGNPDLRSSKSEHTVAGVRQTLEGGWSLQVEAYTKTFDDLAVPDPSRNYLNIGSGRAQGLELLAKKDRTGRWSGWLSLSQSRSTRRNDVTGQGIVFSNDQPWIANAVAVYFLSKKVTLGFNGRYHSGTPWTPVVGTVIDPDGRRRPVYAATGSSRLPDYHRLDLRISRDFAFRIYKMSAYLDLINVYARRNVSGYSYNADFSAREPVYQLPFFPSFGVTAEF